MADAIYVPPGLINPFLSSIFWVFSVKLLVKVGQNLVRVSESELMSPDYTFYMELTGNIYEIYLPT